MHKKPYETDFDLIVIGTGAAGEVAAYLSSKKGKKVAVVESRVIGGECPNFGCIPTKAVLQSAEVYATAKQASKFGIRATAEPNFSTIREWKDLVISRTGTSAGEIIYRREGIRLLKGEAHFLNPWTISIKGNRYTADKFLIATGTKSIIPPITGLEEAGFITYEQALDLKKPPRSLFIIGGGVIGCEFAQIFSSFDSKVTIADIAPRLLNLEDPEVGIALADTFTNQGLKVLTDTKIVRVSKVGKKKMVNYEREGKTHQITVDEILLATGKAPNTDLGLENAGVKYTKAGITVNKYLQTSAKHIYAAGDVTGPYRFTHTASYQSRIVAQNLYSNNKKAVAYHAVPRCIFVDPEIACVGQTEAQLQAKKIRYQVSKIPIGIIGRANTSDVENGFVKVIANKKGVLVGASIMSPRAGEMIHELTLAIQHRMKASAITETIHAFPTWSEAIRLACHKIRVR